MDGYLYAIEANTRDLKWKFQTGNCIKSSPAVTNDIVYVGSDDCRLYAVDTEQRVKKWEFYTGDAVTSSLLSELRTVYVASLNGKIYAHQRNLGGVMDLHNKIFMLYNHHLHFLEINTVYVGSDNGNLYTLSAQ